LLHVDVSYESLASKSGYWSGVRKRCKSLSARFGLHGRKSVTSHP